MSFAPREQSANDDPFRRRDHAGTPLFRAVEELALRVGRTMDEFEGELLGDIFALVEETYSRPLPDFWRVWEDWNRPDAPAEMGDL